MKRFSWLLWVLLLAACQSSEPADATPQSITTAISTQTEAKSPAQAAAELDEHLPTSTPISIEKYAGYQMVTLLPPDAIPAIDNPQFTPAAEADEFYDPDELVIGVKFNGDARAYSVPLLSNHEIVNDTVGGVKIAVTW